MNISYYLVDESKKEEKEILHVKKIDILKI